MTSSLLRPRRPLPGPPAPPVPGGTDPTRILDWRHPRVAALLARLPAADGDPRRLLRAAHTRLAREVRPVYAVAEQQPVSVTLRRGRGSCSQRMAVLEALARASGVPTRVRGLIVDGAFWYPRFPRLRALVPDQVVLAWPEFRLADGWVPVSELYGPLPELAADGVTGFANASGETLFDAVSRTAVDWDGATSRPGECSTCDLSAHVLADLGHYPSRDTLFTTHGQTLCPFARTVADPLLSRWSPSDG
ncbi:hypothetical protein GCM10027168_29120 [Streptomyces capparidis]